MVQVVSGLQRDTSRFKIVKLKSPSKINLALWIKEKRSDGYHEIETVFYENNDLSDDVEIEFTKSDATSIEILFVQDYLNKSIPNEKNLAYKAAALLLGKAGVNGKCRIKINKNIPLEAGLGGGSSNAATVLKGLNQIFSNQFHENELLTIAEQIGSDVPFFIRGGTCIGSGKGEKLTKLANDLELEIKIEKLPEVSVSTKWAYEQIDSREFVADRKQEIKNVVNAIETKDYALLCRNIFNDFEIVVFSYYPVLIDLRKRMLNEGYEVVGLCGSGSALFGMRYKRNKTF